MTKKDECFVTEEMVSRYLELSKQTKVIEKEMGHLKSLFHAYFDQTVGNEQKGELNFEHYKLQRQIRKYENFIPDITVQKLEELNLNECIEIIKKPDEEKVRSAISLGFLPPSELEDCITKKVSAAIVVKEI